MRRLAEAALFFGLLALLAFFPGLAPAQQMLPPVEQSGTGCAFNTVPPTLTSGWIGWAQCDNAGNLKVNVAVGGSVGTQTNAADAQATSADNSKTVNWNYIYNGTTWDRWRGVGVDGAAATGLGSGVSYLYNATTYNRQRDVVGAVAAGTGTTAQHVAPTSIAAATGANCTSTAAESGRACKASAGNLYNMSVTIGATSGYLMLFDATAVPVDGAVTPLACYPVLSNGTNGYLAIDYSGVPKRFGTGISVSFSTTGCFSKTASATAAFFGVYQ